jgi:hypothetical protein
MGLDQYAYARKGEPQLETQTYTCEDLEGNEFERTETQEIWTDQMELAYWRKHPNLQGWMEQLWREKGGEGEFNCVDVELTAADLEKLEQDIDYGDLPETEGFFFGNPSDDRYREGDLEFIRTAREHMEMGYKIVYTSWW